MSLVLYSDLVWQKCFILFSVWNSGIALTETKDNFMDINYIIVKHQNFN